MKKGIRIAVGQFNELTEEKLRFAAQIGATGVQLNTPKLPGETHWEEKDLRALVDKAEAYGLEARGDRERADPFLRQGDARPAGPRRADRELPDDAAQHRAAPASRSSAFTSCRTRSGARSAWRRAAAAPAARSSTWRWSRRPQGPTASAASSPRPTSGVMRSPCSARRGRSSPRSRCGTTTPTSSRRCCRSPRRRA